MRLDDLLKLKVDTSAFPEATRESVRDAVVAAARQDVSRRRRIVRARRLTAGATVAVVAGVVATSLVLRPSSDSPNLRVQPPTHQTPPPDQTFRTAAQVLTALANAPSGMDPAAAPFWKLVVATGCRTARPTAQCELETFVGNGRPGVTNAGPVVPVASGAPRPSVRPFVSTCPATVVIGGQKMSWTEANSRRWTVADISTMVADHGSAAPGRAAHAYYVFKNAVQILEGTPASANIRKQLWVELAAIPGIKLVGRQKDTLGRVGWRLTLASTVDGFGTQSVLVDTRTGSLLEARDQAPGYPPNETTIMSMGPAFTAPEAAPGAPKPMC